MKTTPLSKKLFLISLSLLFSFSLCAQLTVDSIGKIVIGEIPLSLLSRNDVDKIAPMQVFGPNGEFATGGKITFGDFGCKSMGSMNVIVGEYTEDTDTDQIWLHGKNGLFLTAGSNGSPIAYHDRLSTDKAFNFTCDITTIGLFVSSDKEFKENINILDNSLNSLQKLNGVSYFLKNTMDTIDTAHLSTLKNVKNLSEKEQRELNFLEGNEIKKQNKKELRFGFIAQEVQKIFPELVKENEKGNLSVDYIGLIPIIVESIKELQAENDAQYKKIKELESALNNASETIELKHLVENNKSPQSLSTLSKSSLNNAFLYQNTPNPFQVKTEIRYFLPEEIQSAEIYIFNMQGRLEKRLAASRSGLVEISASDLTPGMYLYTLVVDGKEVDTKRMILTN